MDVLIKQGGLKMAGLNGISAYQKTDQIWSRTANKSTNVNAPVKNESVSKPGEEGQISKWKPISGKSLLVPSEKEGIGMTIGDVNLSDKAKDYLSELKSKFGDMDFIAVSKDKMDEVESNSAAYGNANKTVVLIDEETIEKMANDEEFRKKYEGIIETSKAQLEEAKNSLASSGAKVMNFGMSIHEDGTVKFFATLQKSAENQEKRIEAKKEQNKAEKAKENKAKEKKNIEKHKEKAAKERQETEKLRSESDDFDIEKNGVGHHKEYVKIESNSIEDLVNLVSKFAYADSSNTVMTQEELSVGQNIDFKG